MKTLRTPTPAYGRLGGRAARTENCWKKECTTCEPAGCRKQGSWADGVPRSRGSERTTRWRKRKLRRKAPPKGAAEAVQAAWLAEGGAVQLLAGGERLRRKHNAAWKGKPERARAEQARAPGVLPGRTGGSAEGWVRARPRWSREPTRARRSGADRETRRGRRGLSQKKKSTGWKGKAAGPPARRRGRLRRRRRR